MNENLLSLAEREGVAEIRKRLGKNISRDLDTNLNLARWWRGYHGDLDRIAKNLQNYMESRRAAGFEHPDHVNRYFDLPSIKPYLSFIACSRLYDSVFNERLGAFLFVEKAWSQPKEFVKVMKTSDYIMHCFGYTEKLLQLILRKEIEMKRQIQIVTIFDLAELNMSDYMNLMSPHLKLWKIRSDLWQDWYPEIIQKIIVVNPPRLASTIWSLSKVFLNETNRTLLHLENSHDGVRKHLDSWMIPRAYGGQLSDPNPLTDESCCTRRKKITWEDYYESGRHFGLFSNKRPKPVHADVSANCALKIRIKTDSEVQKILWEFRSNSEIEFCIFFENDNLLENGQKGEEEEEEEEENQIMVYPKLRLVTSKVPEEGVIDRQKAGTYTFHFLNTSHYFQAKLDYIISIV